MSTSAPRTVTRPRHRLLPCALLMTVLSAACSAEGMAQRVVEEAAEQAGAGDVDLDLDQEGGVGLESSEGTLRAGGGELPESFPDGLPTPPGDYEVMTSFEQSADGDLELQVAVMAAGTVDELVAYYEQALAEAGYEVEMHQRLTEGVDAVTLSGRGSEHGVLLQIVADDEGTMVNYGIGSVDGSG